MQIKGVLKGPLFSAFEYVTYYHITFMIKQAVYSKKNSYISNCNVYSDNPIWQRKIRTNVEKFTYSTEKDVPLK